MKKSKYKFFENRSDKYFICVLIFLKIGSDSIIGESTKIGDKSMVKKSVIGKNCSIADKTKIINSIIFDNVTIAEGSIIQGSILCSNVKILQKSEIKDTIIEHRQEISIPSK